MSILNYHRIVNGKYVRITFKDNLLQLFEDCSVLDTLPTISFKILNIHDTHESADGNTTAIILFDINWSYLIVNISDEFKFGVPIPYVIVPGLATCPFTPLNPHHYIEFNPHSYVEIRCCTVCGENARCNMRCKGSIYYEQDDTCVSMCHMNIIPREHYEIQYNKYIVLYKSGDIVNVYMIREECDIDAVLEYKNTLYIVLNDQTRIRIPLIDYVSRRNLVQTAEMALRQTEKELSGEVSIFNNQYWLRELLTYI